ncbi:MAG: VOC family protein, partial [Caulobacteraceae bacterium]
YRLLGVEARDVWQGDNGQQHASGVSATVDGFTLEFDSTAMAAEWNRGWVGRADLAGRVVAGFEVADRSEVDRIYAKLTGEGHRGLQPPYDAVWGARYAVVEDPDGLALGLMSRVGEAQR